MLTLNNKFGSYSATIDGISKKLVLVYLTCAGHL
jgi:hypothetical protein